MKERKNTADVSAYLTSLQETLCKALANLDGAEKTFQEDAWEQPNGQGRTRILRGGDIFEQAGVNYSHVHGSALPAAASARHPELAGHPFEAMGVSLVVHPESPFIPTSHMNVRFFSAETPGGSVWWFGGGFDLTPYYGDVDDARHWHRTAAAAVAPFGDDLYARFKSACDEYFYLKHRKEQRGIGGLFFDDFSDGGFDNAFGLMQSVGNHYLPAYKPIVEKHAKTPFTVKQKEFQLYRRGRYVEFNLVFDRGTLFGLQSGGRTESILMSLPPQVIWHYGWQAEAGSAEESLARDFLQPRDWLSEVTADELLDNG